MLELVREGGWGMLPILLCSITALAIVLGRLWTLHDKAVCPEHLLAGAWLRLRNGELDDRRIVTVVDVAGALGFRRINIVTQRGSGHG